MRLDAEESGAMPRAVLFPDTPSHVLQLVSEALDEFETLPLAGSVRQALRIARLRGDSAEAFRFALELGLSDEGGETRTPDETRHLDWRRDVTAAFRNNRTAKVDAKLLGHEESGSAMYIQPVDEIELLDVPYEEQLSLRSQMERQNRRAVIKEMLATIRNRTFRYLIECETELRLSVTGERLFGRHRLRVDRLLQQAAPDVLAKLAAAIRRASESRESEPRAQALASCRRVLTAIADLVFPARENPYIDGEGRPRDVGPSNYRNRILAALETKGSTHARALSAAVGEFAGRLDSLDDLTQKGVHEEVTESEMEFAVVQTYLLAGEVLSITGTESIREMEGHEIPLDESF